MKKKVLCLHGYQQNSQTFRGKSGAFRKACKSKVDFFFIDAPNIINDDKESEKAWWFSRGDNYFKAQDVTDYSNGFNASFQLIKEVFSNQGPFDGILAFSQGGGFLQLLLHNLETDKELANIINIKFAILISSFSPRSTTFRRFYSSMINKPCLIIYGNTDQVIPPDMTEESFKYFSDLTKINHEGGHYLPMNSGIKEKLLMFLERF